MYSNFKLKVGYAQRSSHVASVHQCPGRAEFLDVFEATGFFLPTYRARDCVVQHRA